MTAMADPDTYDLDELGPPIFARSCSICWFCGEDAHGQPRQGSACPVRFW